MKLAVISFARKDSVRVPQKNMKLLKNKPLILYTIEIMKEIKEKLNIDCYMLTDWHEIQSLSIMNNLDVIWRDHPKEFDDMRLNQWAGKIIKADAYILLQPTNPFRNFEKIKYWLDICINSNCQSAFSVYKKDRNNYVMNGAFYYYTKKQLLENDVVNNSSLLLIDNQDIDIDTEDDFIKAENYEY